MKTLSKEAEGQIIKAAVEAVGLVDDSGMTPNAAIEKIARREKFGSEKVKFLSHAYNTGRQTAQRESSKTALDKFATFPLADPTKIISALYPAKEAILKTASDAGVDTAYTLPPQWLGAREKMEKAALYASFEKTASAPEPVKPSPVAARVFNQHLMLKQAAVEARTQASRCYDKLLGSMCKLAEYFKQPVQTRIKFAAAEFTASTYYGKAGSDLMDWVYSRNKLKEPRAADVKPFVIADFDAQPYNYIKACIDLGQEVNEKRAEESEALTALEKQAVDELAPFVSTPKTEKKAADSLLPVPDRQYFDRDSVRAFLPAQPAVKTTVKQASWSIFDKEAGLGEAWAANDMVSNAVRGSSSPTAEKVHDTYLKLEDPQHDAELRGIRSQALLADLMNDEVIGSHSPDKVTRAYNEISQLAPRAAQQPIMIRTMLRKALGGHLEPHEAQQFTSMETGLMGTSAPTPDVLNPVPTRQPPSAPSPKPDLASALGGQLMSGPGMAVSGAGSTAGGLLGGLSKAFGGKSKPAPKPSGGGTQKQSSLLETAATYPGSIL